MRLAEEEEGRAKDDSFIIYLTRSMVKPLVGKWQRAEMVDGVVRSGDHEFNIRHIYVKGLEILKMKFVLYMVLQRNRIYI